MEDYKFQREYTLKAHSPLIHFQWQSSGATLRATEVKPKLDRYIIFKKGKDNIPESWKRYNNDKKDNNDKNDDEKSFSLKYQLRIVIPEGTEFKEVYIGIKDENGNKLPREQQKYDIYYGNMGADESQYKKGILANAKLTVTCFEEDLLEYIDEIIGDFFIVTNFGTMQNKGFGSFTVEGKKCDRNYIYRTLGNGGFCYRIEPKVNDGRKWNFRRIKMIYSLMKSGHNLSCDGKYPEAPIITFRAGRNYFTTNYSDLYYHRSLLYEYVRIMEVNGKKADMGNEKAWMKQKNIVPSLGKSKKQYDPNSCYVRALLGIGENIEYQSENGPKVKVTIKETSKNIERLDSPIFFKVIDDVVYFVGYEPNNKIYEKTFRFSSRMCPEGMTLDVPKEDDLPDNFMEGFMDYCFNELKKYFERIQKYYEDLSINNPQGYSKLGDYEKDFRDITNITIKRGRVRSE